MLSTLGSGWQARLQHSLERLSRGSRPVLLSADEQWRSGSELDPQAGAELAHYLDQVVVWNPRIDLTAARNHDELCDVVLADAWVLAQATDAASYVVDVGSGMGAPGLPFGILRQDCEVQLVEPRQKRIAFLRTVTGSFERRSATALRGRSETLPALCCDAAVSRATFAPEVWLAEGARLARRVVWVLLAKGEAPSLPGWERSLEVTYEWPLTGVARRAVKYCRLDLKPK